MQFKTFKVPKDQGQVSAPSAALSINAEIESLPSSSEWQALESCNVLLLLHYNMSLKAAKIITLSPFLPSFLPSFLSVSFILTHIQQKLKQNTLCCFQFHYTLQLNVYDYYYVVIILEQLL
jgi:hypothetical protein